MNYISRALSLTRAVKARYLHLSLWLHVFLMDFAQLYLVLGGLERRARVGRVKSYNTCSYFTNSRNVPELNCGSEFAEIVCDLFNC